MTRAIAAMACAAVVAAAAPLVAAPLAVAHTVPTSSSDRSTALAPVYGGDCWPQSGSAAQCVPFTDFLRWWLPTLGSGSGIF
ncbi:hypothetical protein [Nocardia aurea]|uniref:Secreted protein n=1 Tax=Nocardia aurea TaxID=2144174 RepID=A0ABV3FUS8_9NOCA